MRVTQPLPWMVFFGLGISVPGLGQDAVDVQEISYPTSDGGEIFANLYGQGSHAVLLAHGAVFDKESWDPLARRLSAAGLQVLAIDFRGYGKSTSGENRGHPGLGDTAGSLEAVSPRDLADEISA